MAGWLSFCMEWWMFGGLKKGGKARTEYDENFYIFFKKRSQTESSLKRQSNSDESRGNEKVLRRRFYKRFGILEFFVRPARRQMFMIVYFVDLTDFI
jgi:hypothetical protein